MAIIKYNDKEVDTLARLMRAEALGEGELGMLMVGNVVVNRALADCLTFRNITTITDAIFQSPGGFNGVSSNLFYSAATTKEKNLQKVLDILLLVEYSEGRKEEWRMRYTVKQARERAGHSRKYMAEHLRIHPATYARLEKQPEQMTVEQARQFSQETGIPVDNIFFGQDST